MLLKSPATPEMYAELGATPGDGPHQVHAAWLRKAKDIHPDLGGDTEEFLRVKRLYEIVLTKEKICARCDGRGSITVKVNSWMRNKIDCPLCRGSGTRED